MKSLENGWWEVGFSAFSFSLNNSIENMEPHSTRFVEKSFLRIKKGKQVHGSAKLSTRFQ